MIFINWKTCLWNNAPRFASAKDPLNLAGDPSRLLLKLHKFNNNLLVPRNIVRFKMLRMTASWENSSYFTTFRSLRPRVKRRGWNPGESRKYLSMPSLRAQRGNPVPTLDCFASASPRTRTRNDGRITGPSRKNAMFLLLQIFKYYMREVTPFVLLDCRAALAMTVAGISKASFFITGILKWKRYRYYHLSIQGYE